MTHRLPAWVHVPAMTFLVMVGFFMPMSPADASPTAVPMEDAGGFESAPLTSQGQPLEAQWVTAGASLCTLVPPERTRLRPTLRHVGSGQEIRAGGIPAILHTAPERTPLQGALPSLRLAARAGRLSAPSTAPPSVSV